MGKRNALGYIEYTQEDSDELHRIEKELGIVKILAIDCRQCIHSSSRVIEVEKTKFMPKIESYAQDLEDIKVKSRGRYKEKKRELEVRCNYYKNLVHNTKKAEKCKHFVEKATQTDIATFSESEDIRMSLS